MKKILRWFYVHSGFRSYTVTVIIGLILALLIIPVMLLTFIGEKPVVTPRWIVWVPWAILNAFWLGRSWITRFVVLAHYPN